MCWWRSMAMLASCCPCFQAMHLQANIRELYMKLHCSVKRLLLRLSCTYAVGIHFHLHSHDFTGVASPSMHIAGFSSISFSLLLTCHCMICTFPDLRNGHFRVFWSWIPASISASSVEPLRNVTYFVTLSLCHCRNTSELPRCRACRADPCGKPPVRQWFWIKHWRYRRI